MAKKILIIEDEEGIANAFKKQLELIGGYEVTLSNNGKKALELLQNNKFDTILLDLVMPDFDGIAFLKEYKDQTKNYIQAPIIVLTNVSSEETKKEVEKYKVSKYIVKTDVVPKDLIADIEEVSK